MSKNLKDKENSKWVKVMEEEEEPTYSNLDSLRPLKVEDVEKEESVQSGEEPLEEGSEVHHHSEEEEEVKQPTKKLRKKQTKYDEDEYPEPE